MAYRYDYPYFLWFISVWSEYLWTNRWELHEGCSDNIRWVSHDPRNKVIKVNKLSL
jgi:hypothetical protein